MSELTFDKLEKVEHRFEEVLRRTREEVMRDLQNKPLIIFDPKQREEEGDPLVKILKQADNLWYNENPEIECVSRALDRMGVESEYMDHVRRFVDEVRTALRHYMENPPADIVERRLVVIGVGVKPHHSLYSSYNTAKRYFEAVEKDGKDGKEQAQLMRDEMLERIASSVWRHEMEKMTQLSRRKKELEEQNYSPKQIERALSRFIPYTRKMSGGNDSFNARAIGAFGEHLQPHLFLLHESDDVAYELKERIKSTSLKSPVKAMVLEGIVTKDDPECLMSSGGSLNFYRWRDDLEGIADVSRPFLGQWGNKSFCDVATPEWEALFSVLFPYRVVGPRKIYNDPEAINRKVEFLNAHRVSYGKRPIPTISLESAQLGELRSAPMYG